MTQAATDTATVRREGDELPVPTEEDGALARALRGRRCDGGVYGVLNDEEPASSSIAPYVAIVLWPLPRSTEGSCVLYRDVGVD